MKTPLQALSLAGLLLSGLAVTACKQPKTPTPPAPVKSPVGKPSKTARPKPTKTVFISIGEVRGGGSSATTDFAIGPKPTSIVPIEWNGYGFLCYEDSGRQFFQCSNDLAFQNHPTAQFIITKQVTLTDQNGSPTVFRSKRTVTVKRGVPAKF